MPPIERVLCFPRPLLDQLGVFQGLCMDTDRYIPAITAPENLVYRIRHEVEQDTQYKQVIPYVLLISGDRILRYERGHGGQEDRLHGLYSIGIGGHISDEDRNLFSSNFLGYHEAMRREVDEEVAIRSIHREAVAAVINDDSTAVGSVHFAIVHVVEVANEEVVGRRRGIVAPEFVPICHAIRGAADYETWSRLCLERMEDLLERAAEIGKEVELSR